MPRKLILIGPESTGKTTLSIYLAKLYNFDLITEYSRIYLSKTSNSYSYEDLKKIAIQIGSDVPICLMSKSVHLSGIGNNFSRIIIPKNHAFLLIYPLALSSLYIKRLRLYNGLFFFLLTSL